MKVGIIQSNFLPWRGYFDFIREVDLFILHDDLQYTKGDWRNRNKIKTPRGGEWITVPVNYKTTSQLIEETTIDHSTRWAAKMLNRIRESYRQAPHFEPYFSQLSELLLQPAATISELNLRLIRWVCGHLGIETPIRFSREFHPQGAKTERLVGILKQVNADAYLSGPAAQAYLVPELLENEGIRLEYKKYEYPEYPQLYPPFEPYVSVIDLLFMTGEDARRYLYFPKEQSHES
ncbi:MAG: WbqC family protein [Chloroflexi bacterium]|nr:WbqC family protein [Chloroflexota bacterium]MCA2001918.1 WbqC family protein [Chloroflexota bacterium]